ncbi:DUF4397 domain-containing protein [Colwellia sp. E2M01]|uniref:DUF4397 domain-containing protein n=1 Tax=Colwellia sp. E2M01 TaxID=2841561 RepID=UPI001C0956E2|nr:DUF4397 domain-containing protein [Colwellia sp. E2M01]MBU2872135.1 DUF4397 domain-containing protein [Colwellia sp. E2M01]
MKKKKFMPKNNTLKTCLASSLLLFALFGCNDSDSSSGEGYVKLYHLSDDAPAIYLTIDEDLAIESDSDNDHYESTYNGVTYGGAHSNITLDSQNYEFQLAWQDDDSNDVADLAVIYESTLNIAEDTIQMIVLSDSILSPQVMVYNIPEIDEDDDDTYDLFNMRVLNMHSSGEAIDFYISDEDETFNEAMLFGQFAYQELSENQKLDQDDYIFYITAAGSDEVLFTSASIPFSFSSQNIMVIKDNKGAGSSPYSLDKMSDSSVIEYSDTEAEAQFRAYNSVANQEELADYNEVLSLHLNGVSDEPIIADLAYGEVSADLVLSSGNYSLDVTTGEENTPLLANHLLSITENTNKTVFIYSEQTYVDDDNDGDIDENNDGIIDEIEVDLYTLTVSNSLLTTIYTHEIEIVNLIQSDDFSQATVYFVRQNETIETAVNRKSVNYKTNNSISLKNNTYQVFVVTERNGSSIILNTFNLVLDEDSTEQFLVLENDETSPTGFKTTMFSQTLATTEE